MDIEQGIAGTDIKAGAIKVATEEEVTPQIELMLARGRAHASRDRRADPDPLEPVGCQYSIRPRRACTHA